MAAQSVEMIHLSFHSISLSSGDSVNKIYYSIPIFSDTESVRSLLKAKAYVDTGHSRIRRISTILFAKVLIVP